MNKDTNDTRTLCKYGENCYQKNPNHLMKFRHPLKSSPAEEESKDSTASPQKKRIKVDNYVEEETTSQCESLSIEDDDDEDVIFKETPSSIEEIIKLCYLVDMPKDFYDFWKLCTIIDNKIPQDAFSGVGLKLVGPFDLLSGKISAIEGKSRNRFLRHWRFFHDPPEFQTVVAGANEFRIGYFRDDPSESPVFLGSMSAQRPGVITTMKEDLISSVYSYINSSSCKAGEAQKERLSDHIESFAKDKGYILDSPPSDRLKERKKRVVSKSFHGAGIVVPVNKKTDVGYREIPETDANLKRMLQKVAKAPTKDAKESAFEAIHELMTNAQWATDEGDFGMGLELGMDFFVFGCEEFHSSVSHLLGVAYELLGRQPFAVIIKAHLKNRRRGDEMNAFDEK